MVEELAPWNLRLWVEHELTAGRAILPGPRPWPQPQPQPVSSASSDADEPHYPNLPRKVLTMDPDRWNLSLRRYWHHGARGQGNPRGIRSAQLETAQALAPDAYPRPIFNRRKGVRIDPPQSLFATDPPMFASRPQAHALRGCIMVPSLILPDTYGTHPDFARAYYMDNNGLLRCMLPCSTAPFCPFQSACGRKINSGTAETTDDHSGHQCSRCKEFSDEGRSPFEWFEVVPRDALP